jgi:hypothetical protein
MKKCFYSIFALLLIANLNLFSQSMNSRDLTVPIWANVQSGANPSITINWFDYGFADNFVIFKKLANATTWGNPLQSIIDTSVNKFTDYNVKIGTKYEYQIIATGKKLVKVNDTTNTYVNFSATGYITTGIEVVPNLTKGSVIILVDETMNEGLANELNQMKADLIQEGYNVVMATAPRADSFDKSKVISTKNIINDIYTQNPNLSNVILIGRIAVPYSGYLAPDAHTDHYGAWPADVYYAVNNNFWTDMTVNNSDASRAENKNIIGDGKYDQTALATNIVVPYAVGRIDFSKMEMFFDSTLANPEMELVRKYLYRNHQWRTNQLEVVWKGVVDDNFSAQSYPEGFAASGWRAFTNFFDRNDVIAADFITTLSTEPYLWSYGCGGGSFTSAGGIGNYTDFKSNKINGIFSLLFGSYFGDWDAKNNLLRSVMAADPGALTIAWSGRPHWFFHKMNLGEPIGTSLLATQNNNNLYYPNVYYNSQYPNGILYTSGTRQVHIGLLGDPTLRMFNTNANPPTELSVIENTDGTITLKWIAPEGQNSKKFVIYRNTNKNANYILLTDKPIEATEFTDNFLYDGTLNYMVMSLELNSSRSGTFYNQSLPLTGSVKTVSVDEEIAEFSIFPNPVVDNLNISFVANANQSIIEISDIQGNIIYHQIIETSVNSSANLSLRITNLNNMTISSGVYLVKITSGKQTSTEKFVVY